MYRRRFIRPNVCTVGLSIIMMICRMLRLHMKQYDRLRDRLFRGMRGHAQLSK